MIEETMRRLLVLEGTWTGSGVGRYPTIDPFEYTETLRFEVDQSYPMLHYEQRAFLKPDRSPSHWESGFIRPQEDGSVEISSSQDSGRVEVLRCEIANSGEADVSLQLIGKSIVLGHDPRLVETGRTLVVRGNGLAYRAEMATRTTPVPKMIVHLTANLTRK